jgi:hypothetical protein
LVLGGIGGQEAGAVADLDIMVVEAPVGLDPLLGLLGDGPENVLQRGLGQASAGLAIRTGIVTEVVATQRGQPGNDLADGI